MKKMVILGAGESGKGTAILAQQKGYDVLVSDAASIAPEIKSLFDQKGIRWEEKTHSTAEILQADLVMKSPGIPAHVEIVKSIRAAGIVIQSEIEFASKFTPATIIGITGSNGKTTTTLLIYHILEKAGLNVGLAGNIGTSFAQQVAQHDFDYYVLEISSFQLDDIHSFAPSIGVITNITPDHLDRYNYDFSQYVASKLRLTMNQTEDQFLLFNADDAQLKLAIEQTNSAAKKFPFGMTVVTQPGATFQDETIKINTTNTTTMINTTQFPLQGRHNLLNAMAAASVASLLDISKDSIRNSLLSFTAVEHRLERVLKIQNRTYINDSKATNVNATFYALESMEGQTVWIVGGVDKGNDYSSLLPLVREKVKAIICLGVDNDKIIESFSPVVDLLVETQSMREAVKMAHQLADKREYVLLSPACASFDLFKNYEDRGNQFKEAVRGL
ncbi:MAG: UDP-N-acetylmuramoyl-L-alanine--D-glutamate ligase [Flavobacteriaceae bacterium]|nr:UDP-N-acetylmuramoyl-L-alanine--D-glutamate ligase [Flavobacteriaceae bacterium]